MRKQRQLLIFILILTVMFVLPFVQKSTATTAVNADSNLQVMKNSSGNDMTYRNSSEKVYGLKEYDYPTAEYRAVWVSTFVSDIPKYTTEEKFKSDATALLDDLVSMGMNAMVFHVRTHNNALYNSDLNPIATWWVDVDFDKFDPLTWLINETHKRGIEFHAWMNPYRITDGYVGEAYPEGHPCLDSTQVLTSSSGAKILDPGSTRVQDFIVDTCMEFLDRYDADAIHFDDYFYISGVATNISANEKRQNVDNFIKKLSDKMKAMNEAEGRAVQLGISPSGIYQNGKYAVSPTYDENGSLISPISSNTSGFAHYGDYLYSDTKKWIDNEWIDYITPQTYWGMEHTGANFYELSRWWSWCVRYKKVNLYLGIGIYMADSTGSSANYWKKNQNEVQNQILNSGMYDEVKGLCYYKYSYLSSSNSIIKNGVDLIKNDYYSKRIPGAVIQRYANSLPSVEATNLALNGNVLSWDKIDNVFGYMVYQVPKGETLDINNIDHVYVYTQDTSVSNVDTLKYDYYVSSVNRANVKSNPVQFGAPTLSAPELVVALINNLPSTITLEEKTSVQNIRQRYEGLSDSDKALVVNYSVLVNAEKTISALSTLKNKASSFISTLDTKINKDRILPIEDGMKWSYVNISDASKYDLTTGKRLINYIAPMIIELNLEVTDGTYTYKEVVEFDLCFLDSDKTGLYYRNDASSMSELHVGAHTGQTSYIGWANATLTVENQVLFIAYNNFHELKDSNIPSCNWTSCAGVYYNTSTTNISMTLGQAFETATPTYGYFVVGSNNKIKLTSDNAAADVSVTLAPGEALVIVRYLDRLITNTPFKDVTGFSEGKTAYITIYGEEETPVIDDVQKVITLIDTIPTNVTLEDEQTINDILAEYNALSSEDQTKVTNSDKLTLALNQIASLKEAVVKAKEQAIKDIEGYVVLTDYSETNQATIKGYISKFKTSVESCSDIGSIDKLVLTTKGQIDNVKTLTEELADYKATNLDKLQKLVDKSLYSEENQAKIQGFIDTAIEEINSATSNILVDQALNKAQALINQLPTYEEELSIYRENVNTAIFEYASLNDYRSENQAIVDNIVYQSSLLLNEAKTYKEMDAILEDAKKQIDNVPTKEQELILAKENAIKEINDAFDFSSYESPLKEALEELKEKAVEEVNQELNINKICTIVTNYKNAVNIAILKDYATTIVNDYKATINYDEYSVENQELINTKLDIVINTVTVNSTKESINQELTAVITDIKTSIKTLLQELKVYKEEVIAYLGTYKDVSENTEYINAEYEKVLAQATNDINNATTKEEVEEISNNVVNQYKVVCTTQYAIYAKERIESSINMSNYSTDSQAMITAYLEQVTADITSETTKDDIDLREVTVTLLMNNIPTIQDEIAELKQEVYEYLISLLDIELSESKSAEVENLVSEKLTELDLLNTLEEIKNLKEVAETAYNNIVNKTEPTLESDDKKGCSCGASTNVFYFISLLAVAILILRKKH